MKRFYSIILPILFVLLVIYSCKHEPPIPPGAPDPTGETGGNTGGGEEEPDPCNPDIIYFEQQILPIFQANCATAGCHNAGTAEDGVVLDNYANIFETGDIDPYDPWDSEVYEVIMENDPDDRMPPPPSSPLPQELKNLIRDWILQGAQNTSCETTGCDTENVSFSNDIFPIIQSNCVSCHSGSNANAGIQLTNYSQISHQALNGLLLSAVSHDGMATPMPYQSNQLSSCKIEMITAWINNGAPNN